MCEPLIWLGSDMIAVAEHAEGLEALVDRLLAREVADIDLLELDLALAVQSEPLRSMIITVVVNTMQQLWAQENPYWECRAR